MTACRVLDCTTPKPPGSGRHYCAEHQAEAKERRRTDSIARMQAWSADNREYHRLLNRTATYGLTVDEFLTMVDDHDGCCAICRMFGGLKLEIDHDHSTGKVRGLLCGTCNSLLGLARDKPHILEAASAYLISPLWNQALEGQP